MYLVIEQQRQRKTIASQSFRSKDFWYFLNQSSTCTLDPKKSTSPTASQMHPKTIKSLPRKVRLVNHKITKIQFNVIPL